MDIIRSEWGAYPGVLKPPPGMIVHGWWTNKKRISGGLSFCFKKFRLKFFLERKMNLKTGLNKNIKKIINQSKIRYYKLYYLRIKFFKLALVLHLLNICLKCFQLFMPTGFHYYI